MSAVTQSVMPSSSIGRSRPKFDRKCSRKDHSRLEIRRTIVTLGGMACSSDPDEGVAGAGR